MLGASPQAAAAGTPSRMQERLRARRMGPVPRGSSSLVVRRGSCLYGAHWPARANCARRLQLPPNHPLRCVRWRPRRERRRRLKRRRRRPGRGKAAPLPATSARAKRLARSPARLAARAPQTPRHLERCTRTQRSRPTAWPSLSPPHAWRSQRRSRLPSWVLATPRHCHRVAQQRPHRPRYRTLAFVRAEVGVGPDHRNAARRAIPCGTRRKGGAAPRQLGAPATRLRRARDWNRRGPHPSRILAAEASAAGQRAGQRLRAQRPGRHPPGLRRRACITRAPSPWTLARRHPGDWRPED